jgi:hypothetical protein
MTVKELKTALKGVPNDTEVWALKDGTYCEKTEVWGAYYQEDDNQNAQDSQGNATKEFVINC